MVVRATGDILMMTLSRILTVVVGTQIYTRDKSIEHTHKYKKSRGNLSMICELYPRQCRGCDIVLILQNVNNGRNWARVQGISLYHFLQLHVNSQLSHYKFQ